MPSPADRQSEANAEVERIAQALYEEIHRPLLWTHAPGVLRQKWCDHTRALLLKNAICPPKRPAWLEPPLTGQTTIEEQLDD